MSDGFLITGPEDASVTLLLAHGAGGAMDSQSMTAATNALTATGLRMARFEFGYMAERRRSGRRQPAPRADTLIEEYRAAVSALASSGPLIIGGKSMGGRVVSRVADDLYRHGEIEGLLCLGYPFHPVGKPEQLRTAHLRDLSTPTLICQGTRDPFGTQEEVAAYKLSKTIELLWLEDGDHDLKPRKGVSGFTAADHLKTMAQAVSSWAAR